MATINISVPDDVIARLKAKLEPHGYTVEDFTSASLSNFADVEEFIPTELESKLLTALDTPLVDAQSIDWDAKLQRFRRD